MQCSYAHHYQLIVVGVGRCTGYSHDHVFVGSVYVHICIIIYINAVAENGPSSPVSSTSGNRSDGDDKDDSSSTPTIVIGIIAGIAIISLIVIGVILTTFYLRYVATYFC